MTKKGGNKGDEDEDRTLWHHVTRSIRPYGRNKPAATPAPVKKKKLAGGAVPEKFTPPTHTTSKPAASPKGFDRSTETKLKRGKLPLEGSLDLHGMTQAEAYAALCRFVRAAVRAEKRTLLIITGKGARSEGVLKKMLPLWLEEPSLAAHVLALTPAQPKDGGAGAFYLRLRRARES